MNWIKKKIQEMRNRRMIRRRYELESFVFSDVPMPTVLELNNDGGKNGEKI